MFVEHFVCPLLSLVLCFFLLLLLPVYSLLLPYAPSKFLHFGTEPDPMSNGIFSLSAKPALILHPIADAMELAFNPSSSSTDVSCNGLLLWVMLLVCFVKGLIVELASLCCVASSSCYLISCSGPHGIDEWSYVLPWCKLKG